MANTAIPGSEAQLFVVHVWCQRTQFRATVRRVDADETFLFTKPGQLARYLSTVAVAAPAAHAQPLDGDPHE